jgi:hypothetical protein
MSYAFIQDVPADEAIYRKVQALLPTEPPAGLVAHLVIKREVGLRYVDVWESESEWLRFRDEHVEPAVECVLASVGIRHDHSLVSSEAIEVIDVWLGARQDSPVAGSR